jgi:hypothetical protein
MQNSQPPLPRISQPTLAEALMQQYHHQHQHHHHHHQPHTSHPPQQSHLQHQPHQSEDQPMIGHTSAPAPSSNWAPWGSNYF